MTEWPGSKVIWNPKELEAEWYKNNKQFVPQDEQKEFHAEWPEVMNRPASTFQEIGDELNLSKVMANRIYHQAMGKLRRNLEAAGITAESLRKDPEFNAQIPRSARELIDHQTDLG